MNNNGTILREACHICKQWYPSILSHLCMHSLRGKVKKKCCCACCQMREREKQRKDTLNELPHPNSLSTFHQSLIWLNVSFSLLPWKQVCRKRMGHKTTFPTVREDVGLRYHCDYIWHVDIIMIIIKKKIYQCAYSTSCRHPTKPTQPPFTKVLF